METNRKPAINKIFFSIQIARFECYSTECAAAFRPKVMHIVGWVIRKIDYCAHIVVDVVRSCHTITYTHCTHAI